MAAVLGWVQRRWHEVLEPVVSGATVEQEARLRELWERELDWWKTQRGLAGDSLRKPITQVRMLIKGLPVTEQNRWENPRTQGWEHIGLKVFNLSGGEWVAMNARVQGVTQERLSQRLCCENMRKRAEEEIGLCCKGIVNRAFRVPILLLFSFPSIDDQTEKLRIEAP